MKYQKKHVTLRTGEDLCLREAAPSDAVALLALMKDLGAESRNLLMGSEGLPFSVEQEENFLRTSMENPRMLMLLAVMDGEPICSAQVAQLGTRRRVAHRGSIAIAIRKKHWNKGIGTLVMKELVTFARTLGLEVLELEVCADNKAGIRLYEKTGFTHVGCYHKFFKYEDGSYADAAFMHMLLT